MTKANRATPLTADAVRQAAKRVQYVTGCWIQDDIDAIQHAPARDVMNLWKYDLTTLTRFALAALPEDDGPVTEEWLKNHYPAVDDDCPIVSQLKIIGETGYWYFDDDGALIWHHAGHTTAIITTRNQFRQLAAALGITPTHAGNGNQKQE